MVAGFWLKWVRFRWPFFLLVGLFYFSKNNWVLGIYTPIPLSIYIIYIFSIYSAGRGKKGVAENKEYKADKR
jgi:hypothetical protein